MPTATQKQPKGKTLVVETQVPDQKVVSVIEQGKAQEKNLSQPGIKKEITSVTVQPIPETATAQETPTTVNELVEQIQAPVDETQTPVIEENEVSESADDLLKKARAQAAKSQKNQSHEKQPPKPKFEDETDPTKTATYQIEQATSEAAEALIHADQEQRLAGIQLGIKYGYDTTIKDVGTGQRIGQLLALKELAGGYKEIETQLNLLRQHNDGATCDIVKKALEQSGFRLEPLSSGENDEKKKLSPSLKTQLIAGFLPSHSPTPGFSIFEQE